MPTPPRISARDRVHRRAGHITVTVLERYVLVWGGYMEHLQETHNAPIRSDYHSTDEIWLYDPVLEVWNRVLTGGDIPPRQSGTCGVVLDDILYIFGGYLCAEDSNVLEGNSNQLFRLNLHTLKWEWLHPSGVSPLPCDKLVGWTHAGLLYFFGGFGPPPQDMREFPVRFQHIVDVSTVHGWPRGWNNQLVAYDPTFNQWLWPKTNGKMPSPRAAHAGSLVGERMFVFGGRFVNSRMSDLHCLDLRQMNWSGELEVEMAVRPQGRSWTSLSFLTPTCALLYGGFNQYNNVLNDCWLLDVAKFLEDGASLPAWKEVKLPYDHGEPRCWHGATLISEGDLVVHSGVTQPYYETRLNLRDHAEDMLIFRVSPKSLLRLCLDATVMYRQSLESDWNSLPRNLQDALQARCGLRGDYWCPVDPVTLHL